MMPPRLSEVCLDIIVDNFPRYNAAFTTSNDETMKRMLEFLRRKYSYDLLVRLAVKEDSLEEYVDFLINKNLKSLDTSWLRNCSWEKVNSKMAEIGSNIEKIVFQDVYFDKYSEDIVWEDIICYLPNLKSFTFNNGCNDLILKNVAKFCPNIEEIDFENSDVTDEAVKSLCRNESGKALCTKLKKLYIAGSNIGEDGVKYLLKHLPCLEVIDYPDVPLMLYSMHKSDLLSLDKVEPYNIGILDFLNCAHTPFFADILKVCLSVCPNLKFLNCSLGNKNQLDLFPKLPNLEHLSIESVHEMNIDILLKLNGEKLTFLSITNCKVSLSVLAESCPCVEEFVFNADSFLFDDGYKPTFHSLTSITFESLDVFMFDLAVSVLLSSSTKLESISFKRCNVLQPELKICILKCCEMYPIKKISFCFCYMEREYLEDLLLNCKTLKYLDIDGCFDTDVEEDLIELAEMLPNKPEIFTSEHIGMNDYGQYLNGIYEFDDSELDSDSDSDVYEDSDDNRIHKILSEFNF